MMTVGVGGFGERWIMAGLREFMYEYLHFHRNGCAIRTEPPSVGTALFSPRHRRAHRLSTDRQTARLPIQSRCSLLGSLPTHRYPLATAPPPFLLMPLQ